MKYELPKSLNRNPQLEWMERYNRVLGPSYNINYPNYDVIVVDNGSEDESIK